MDAFPHEAERVVLCLLTLIHVDDLMLHPTEQDAFIPVKSVRGRPFHSMLEIQCFVAPIHHSWVTTTKSLPQEYVLFL